VTGDQWLEEETQHVLRFLEIAGRAMCLWPGRADAADPHPARNEGMGGAFRPHPVEGRMERGQAGPTYHPDDPALVPPMPEGAPTAKPIAQDAVHA
jgi:hypothetical protein